MGKRKNADQLLLDEARKTLKEAPKRSLEYKEARKLVEEMEGKPYESDVDSEDSDATDSSDTSDEEDEDEEDEEEEEEEDEPKPNTRATKRAKKEAKAGTSSAPAKSKASPKKPRKAATKKQKKGVTKKAPVVGKKGKKSVKTLTRSFVKDKDEETNEYYYEAQIGQGHVVQLSKYLKTGNHYFSVRKPGTAGVTISVDFFDNLRDALKEIKEKFPEKLKNE